MKNNFGSSLEVRKETKESQPMKSNFNYSSSVQRMGEKTINKMIKDNCDLEKLENVLKEINKNTDNILVRFFGEEGKEKSNPEELNLYGFKLEDIDLVNEIKDTFVKNSRDFICTEVFTAIEKEINNIMDLCYEKDNIRNLKSFNIESYFNEYLEKNVLYTCDEQIDELPEKVSTIVLDIEEALIDFAKKDIINLLNSLHSIKEKINEALEMIKETKNNI